MLIGFDTAKSTSATVLSAVATINSTYSSLHSHYRKFHHSDDQIAIYQEQYLNVLQDTLAEVSHSSVPIGIIATMVNVRNCERFFASNHGIYRNVPAGTLVSENFVSNNYDFFLVSQQATKGTMIPNHYRVVYCTSKMEEGLLQELIFSQCFNYVNWTGSIKVPAVLQYAKKCAKFVAEVMDKEEEVPKDMRNKPYYV
ncbi:uncharacterized protein LOC116268319 [Nymphaea colorata]|uniref:uncharacterized protein LOC116268319 n=1 Tax=Nymphaea colorata TaxID=210225 RepID=UPI00129E1366|nr:uncharacterized protein LOC116268319 [Nymphaea colorata]